MRIHSLTGLATGLALAAVLAACSTGTSRPHAANTGSGSSSSSGSEIAAIVACFRQHGAPSFPDPVYDPGDGRWHFAVSPASVPAATRATCQHLFPATSPSPPVPQAQFQQLMRLARCLRQNGVPNWPDPDPQGAYPLPPALMHKSPQGDRALAACRHVIPSGGYSVIPAS